MIILLAGKSNDGGALFYSAASSLYLDGLSLKDVEVLKLLVYLYYLRSIMF